MLIDVLISTVLIVKNDGPDRCFLDSQRNCFYSVISTANKSNSDNVTPSRNSEAVTPENPSYSLRNQENGVYLGELQAKFIPQIKHQ